MCWGSWTGCSVGDSGLHLLSLAIVSELLDPLGNSFLPWSVTQLPALLSVLCLPIKASSCVTICHSRGEQPQAPPKSCHYPSPDPRGSNGILLSVWMGFFPLVLFPQAAIALPPRQAVLLCLHWPDVCRVVTRGFLGMAPGAVSSQRKRRGAFCSVSGLLHKVGTALGLAMHGLTKQTDLTPDRPHPPCSFRADVLFGLSLSQCPDECGSCQHLHLGQLCVRGRFG